MKNGIYLAYLSALTNASIVGLSFLFTKKAVTLSNPLDTLASRFTIAFFTLTLLIVLKIIKLEFKATTFKKLLPLTLLYPTLFFVFQAYGLETVQSSEAGILFATIPILTTILAAFFLKERTTIYQKISIFFSVFGVVFIFIMKGNSFSNTNWNGVLLLVASCLSLSGYTVLTRSLVKSYKPIEITYFMLMVGFFFFNTLSISRHLISKDLNSMLIPWSDLNFIGSILFLGILASFVTSLLSNYILSKIPASQMSVFSNMSTVISIIAGGLILNEEIFYFHIIGSLFIIFGVIGTNLLREKPIRNKVKKSA
ncbi:DMT family transporter [Neobacillus sp. SCS-31]|uniref:DMT family transporter n=1 Tax=Neobacillus oceani TaxID=3115292 RepID=UPI0039063437